MIYGEVEGIKKPVARVIQGTTMLGSDLNEVERILTTAVE